MRPLAQLFYSMNNGSLVQPSLWPINYIAMPDDLSQLET